MNGSARSQGSVGVEPHGSSLQACLIWIERFHRRLTWGAFLRRAAEFLAAFLFVFGTAVLIVRLFVPELWPHVLWLGCGAVPATAAAWWLARRDFAERASSVAMLDEALHTGGLLMTLVEQPEPAWESADAAAAWAGRLPQSEVAWQDALPRFRPTRFARLMGLPLLFAAAALIVPLRDVQATTDARGTVGRQATKNIEDLLEELKQEEVLSKEEQKQLEQEIDKLKEETRDNALTHEKWEQVDALRERMQARVEKNAAAATRLARTADLLLQAAGGQAQGLTSEAQQKLNEELQKAMTQMMKQGLGSRASSELRQQLERLTQNGEFRLPSDPGEREQLLQELKQLLDEEEKRLGKLRSKCQGGQCEANEFSNQEGESNSELPGRGGVTRGRGDADLTWGAESDKQGTKFKETVLPKGFLDQPGDQTVGIERTAPIEQPGEASVSRGAREIGAASGDSTWRRKLNPRHRQIVREYFQDRTQKPASAVPTVP
jgi:hypothetical protein